ncbi:hypothetical protein D3C86_2236850 [compost metagenome]
MISISLSKRIAIKRDSGMETIEMMVDRMFRRNSMIMTTANKAPKAALLSMVLIDC